MSKQNGELATPRVSNAEFFLAYQDLLAEKGFDEKKRPMATLKDLGERFPTLKPLTVKQKLYSVLEVVNSNPNGQQYPMLPSGEPRKKRESKKPQMEAELLRLAACRKVFNSVD